MEQGQEERFGTEQAGFESTPVLKLDIDDDKLIKFLDTYSDLSSSFFDKEKNIPERRKLMKRYFFGRQLEGRTYNGVTQQRELKSYEKPYIDNVLKEGEDILRPLVLSRIPDLIVNPGVQSQIPRETADSLNEAVNKTLQSGELKKILTKAFRHHPLNFTAVIKWKWSPNKGRLGDIEFEEVHPDNILMDYLATDNNEKKMKVIIQYVSKSLFDWMMLFPEKEDELKTYAKEKKSWDEAKDPDGRAFTLKIEEVWFDWQEKVEGFDPKEPKFNFESGLLWKLGKGNSATILDKRRNPNWDWDGEEKLFFNNQPVPEELIPQLALLGFDVPGLERRKVFRNFFGQPRKPFIFMGYEQYGEMPMDETSRIEENLLLQENYDIRGMQITKMIDDAKGKNVYSKMSGLKKKTVQDMDVNNPDEDMLLDGDLRQVHMFIKKEQPSNAMFSDLGRTRERMMEKLHLAAPVRGEITSNVATTNQIAREGSFTTADDISDLTINEVSTQMAEALLHMMKLRYTPEHFEKLLGVEGEKTHRRLTADVIEDGMEVGIRASGTDKLNTERQAKDEAQLGLSDPINYMKDTGRTDAEIRAEMAFLFNNAPELYFKRFIKKEEIPDIAQGVVDQNQQNLAAAGGAPVGQVPQQPSPQNPGNIPTTPGGSTRNLFGKTAGDAITGLFRK